MPKRKIIKIDEEKCNGCGLCIPNCPEGAMQVVDGKARLISDLFCDGLGACLGACPQAAIRIEEREAEQYDEKEVMANIVKQGKNVIKAHLEHLKEHNQAELLKQAIEFLEEKDIANTFPASHGKCNSVAGKEKNAFAGCPGSRVMDLRKQGKNIGKIGVPAGPESQLKNWPVQLRLAPSIAPFLNNADLLIAADCVAFTYADFHQDLLKGKVVLVGCPKLDDTKIYEDKIIQILKNNKIKSITYAHMEVPCCFGLIGIIKQAISQSAKDIPFKETVISVKGDKL